MFDLRLEVIVILLHHVQLQQGVEVADLNHGVYPAHTLASYRQLLTSRWIM